MPQFDGMRALHLLRERGLDLPFIVVPGTANEEIAVECMKQGAAAWRSGAWALYRTTTPRTARRHGHCGERGRTRFDISGVVAAL
jgi:CheY-like chemotaxis protein